MVLSGKLWPIHLKPYDDELLSSWLVRLSRAYALKLHTFCKLTLPGELWARDIDKSVKDGVLKILARKTATSLERVFQCTLRAYEGLVYEKHNANGNTKWIMPVGVYHRTRKLYGLQCCPQCLREDEDPYFRRRWRLAFITLCEKHNRLLIDRCPECGEAINFHRNQFRSKAITLCYKCGFDLRNSPLSQKCSRQEVDYQLFLLEAVKNGWINVQGWVPIYSHLYFNALHQIVNVLSVGKRAALLRNCLQKYYMKSYDVTGFFKKGFQRIETLNVASRFFLINMAGLLLADWPERFVALCKKVNILSSDLFRGQKTLPYWYWVVVDNSLNRPKYFHTDVEIKAAANYLKRSKKKIGPTIISKLIGAKFVPRARKLIYQKYR